MNKNKNLIYGLIAVVAVALIGGGIIWYLPSTKDTVDTTNNSTNTSQNNAPEGETNQPDDQGIQGEEAPRGDLSVDSAIVKLENANMNVGQDQGVIFGFVMANGGAKVDVDGTIVEIYSYNAADNQKDGLKALQDMQEAAGEAHVAQIFEHQNLVVVVHSADQAVVNKIKQTIEG